MSDFDITENFSGSQEEIDRVLKYYAEVPVWNLHVSLDRAARPRPDGKGGYIVASIVANCQYADAREGYLGLV